ncbi:MAG: pimeloyl-ACP methyl ester carboxylesterase [Planctomycetota bacterium]|jgi:pimeloyl-ACP methyl ester carboxylesterase
MTAATPSIDDALEAAQTKLAPIRELYPFRSQFIRQGELHQHYLDEGPRDGTPLLFLHGNPTWSFFWRELVGGLSGEYRCIAPDHIGCGLSDKPQDWSYRLADHAENVLRLVEQLDLCNVTLVVHDWGGAIGFAMARRAPERIARVVVMNTAAFRAPKIPLRIAVCRTPLLGKLAVRGLNAFAKAATVMTTVRPLSKAIKRGFLLPYDSWDTRIATHEFVEDIPIKPGHRSWDELVATDEALASFTDRPMAIFWGEQDWCFSPSFRAEWQRRFPEARVHSYPDAGHYLIEDVGQDLLGKLRTFLSETNDDVAGSRP